MTDRAGSDLAQRRCRTFFFWPDSLKDANELQMRCGQRTWREDKLTEEAGGPSGLSAALSVTGMVQSGPAMANRITRLAEGKGRV
jgi:hypothetical protein